MTVRDLVEHWRELSTGNGPEWSKGDAIFQQCAEELEYVLELRDGLGWGLCRYVFPDGKECIRPLAAGDKFCAGPHRTLDTARSDGEASGVTNQLGLNDQSKTGETDLSTQLVALQAELALLKEENQRLKDEADEDAKLFKQTFERAESSDARLSQMREALLKLSNEVRGLLGFAEEGLREVVGNTNIAALQNRVKAAEEALAGQAEV